MQRSINSHAIALRDTYIYEYTCVPLKFNRLTGSQVTEHA